MEIKTIDLDKVDPSKDSSRVSSVPPLVNTNQKMSNKSSIVTVILFLVTAIAGFYSGATLKNRLSGKLAGGIDAKNIQAEVPTTGVKIGDIYGSADEKAFRDSATGVLDKGGLNGEGTHKIVRPGGASQTVYVTSSVIDLDTLVGHQITAWGETFKGQKVSWLMDIGRVKVENLNMPLPK